MKNDQWSWSHLTDQARLGNICFPTSHRRNSLIQVMITHDCPDWGRAHLVKTGKADKGDQKFRWLKGYHYPISERES